MATAEHDPPDAPAPDAAPSPRRGRGPLVLLGVVALVALGVIGLAVYSLVSGDPDAKTVTYVVPAGTSEKLFYGETVDLMPTEVRLNVGDTLVIRNEDDQTISVGPFTIRGGETLRQTFSRPQTLVGTCSMSASGQIRLVVA